jgi:hypothetical protein
MKAKQLFHICIPALALTSTILFAENPQPVLCPSPRPLTPTEIAQLREDLNTEMVNLPRAANTVVGVDALGRIAIAVDNDGDGMGEHVLLYTDQERIAGPWSRQLQNANVTVKKGSVLVTSRPDEFALAIAVSVADLPSVPRWARNAVSRSGGRELARLFDDKAFVSLSSLDYTSIPSWPVTLHDDLIAQVEAAAIGVPATNGGVSQQAGPVTTFGGCGSGGQCCEDRECDAGGMPSSSCSISGCLGIPAQCQVSGCAGVDPAVFACCQCDQTDGNKAKCRCKACTCGPCP